MRRYHQFLQIYGAVFNFNRIFVLKLINKNSTGDGDKFSCHIMRIFDSDGNGFLDFKEFLMAIDIATCQTEESKLAWAFKLYDLVSKASVAVKQENLTKPMPIFLQGIFFFS